MKWNSHKGIAERVAEDFNLTHEEKQRLLQGVVYPDVVRANHERHHSGRYKTISVLALRSRMALLQGERLESLFELGQCLHFVHDMHCPHALEDEVMHASSWETWQMPSTDSLPRSYADVVRVSRGISPEPDSEQVVWKSMTTSYALMSAVLDSSPPSSRVFRQRRELVRRILLVHLPLLSVGGGALHFFLAHGIHVPRLFSIGIPIYAWYYLLRRLPSMHMALNERAWWGQMWRGGTGNQPPLDEHRREEVPF